MGSDFCYKSPDPTQTFHRKVDFTRGSLLSAEVVLPGKTLPESTQAWAKVTR